jgi:hypothetical protein
MYETEQEMKYKERKHVQSWRVANLKAESTRQTREHKGLK